MSSSFIPDPLIFFVLKPNSSALPGTYMLFFGPTTADLFCVECKYWMGQYVIVKCFIKNINMLQYITLLRAVALTQHTASEWMQPDRTSKHLIYKQFKNV